MVVTPPTGCLLISAHSSSVNSSGLCNTSIGIAIFPISWKRAAMPDYYSEEFNEGEYKAVIAYMKSLRPAADKMPRDWWTNQRIILEGKMIYDGIQNPSVNCAACHGRDGKSVMSGAKELKDANAKGSEKTDVSRKSL